MRYIYARIDVARNKTGENEFSLKIRENDEIKIVTFRSLKILKGFLDGLSFFVNRESDIYLEVRKPGILYAPSLTSGTYFCPLCSGNSGLESKLRHKQFCPNYAEGQPFTPDFENY